MIYSVTTDNFLISTDPALLQVDVVHDYLSNHSYWAAKIPREIVVRAINNSLCFGVYEGNKQIGFARTVTDMATFAYLADVFILPAWRGKGLSKWLMETIQGHPELQGLRRWMLGTRDAHGLYEQFGWSRLNEDASSRIMQRYYKDIYLELAGH